ncbi:hypothetical protein [Cellulomonas sp. NS3]|uniref:hypothetical protein n=1 Tax=Cellulomonas sp. NS3 TaxID=2973977 RepID=UPI0021613C11|nr:hypothetical protein [Cellulomonas sp. NS3]
MTLEELLAAPMPDAASPAWAAFLREWTSGTRAAALDRARDVVQGLTDSGGAARDAAGHWLCAQVFDSEDGWNGQWGGGPWPGEDTSLRPVQFALTCFPLSTGVLLPHVLEHAKEPAPYPRWLFQVLTGVVWRLPPDVRAQAEATLVAVCGPGATPLDLLHRAAAADERAAKMLLDWTEDE